MKNYFSPFGLYPCFLTKKLPYKPPFIIIIIKNKTSAQYLKPQRKTKTQRNLKTQRNNPSQQNLETSPENQTPKSQPSSGTMQFTVSLQLPEYFFSECSLDTRCTVSSNVSVPMSFIHLGQQVGAKISEAFPACDFLHSDSHCNCSITLTLATGLQQCCL